MTTPPPHWTGADPDSRWVSEAHDVAVLIGEEAAEHDRLGDFVADACAVLHDRGFTSMLVPAELGGGGASYPEACASLATLARGCPATALTLSMHTHLAAFQVWRHRHDLPAPVLAKVVDGAILISTGAADWTESNGTAVAVDGGFRVTARKSPSSGCPAGDILVSSARWDDAPDGPKVIHFAAPFASEGVSIDETWDTMGMRATGSHTVVLDDVFVPEAAVSLTREPGWHPVFNIIAGAALPLIMSVYVGVAEEAAERAVTYAGKRRDTEMVAPLVGRMLNRLHTAQDAIGTAVALVDDLRFANTNELAAQSFSRKTVASEAAIDTVRLAMEAAGGVAYSTSAGIERLFRDVHGSLYHPLTAARQEMFSGRLALGLEPVAG